MVPLEAPYSAVYIDTFIFFLRSLCKVIRMNVHYFPNAPRKSAIKSLGLGPKVRVGLRTVNTHICIMPPEWILGASSFCPVCLSVCLSDFVILSVTLWQRTLTLVITFEQYEMETLYMACILN